MGKVRQSRSSACTAPQSQPLVCSGHVPWTLVFRHLLRTLFLCAISHRGHLRLVEELTAATSWGFVVMLSGDCLRYGPELFTVFSVSLRKRPQCGGRCAPSVGQRDLWPEDDSASF